MNSKILITGATGTTSQLAIKSLLNRGLKVRAMVRLFDQRSEQLEELGAEVVKGDFLDLKSLRTTLEGIERVYFCYPFKDGLTKAAGYFAKAAKESGVKLTVSMSQMNVHEGSTSPATQNHLIAEDILDWANIGSVHIRPGLFAWNYLNMAGITVKAEGKFYFPNPDAKYTIIHPQDISDVVAELLISENYKSHIGKKYYLTGPRIFTAQEVVNELGDLLNRKIEYIEIPIEHWVEAMKRDPYVNDFLAKHLREFSKDIANGFFNKSTDVVETLTGHKPREFKTYLKENIDAFK